MNSIFDQLDTLRARSPLADTREYTPVDVGRVATDPTRNQLPFNMDALRPLHQVAEENLNYIADTMRYGDFAHIPFSVAVAATGVAILTRAQSKRIFLAIQNTHATQNLFVGFDVPNPSLTNGLLIGPGGAMFLDAVVAQNDVFITGSGAATTGLLTYCNQAFGRG